RDHEPAPPFAGQAVEEQQRLLRHALVEPGKSGPSGQARAEGELRPEDVEVLGRPTPAREVLRPRLGRGRIRVGVWEGDVPVYVAPPVDVPAEEACGPARGRLFLADQSAAIGGDARRPGVREVEQLLAGRRIPADGVKRSRGRSGVL